jgi:hypothetical protein
MKQLSTIYLVFITLTILSCAKRKSASTSDMLYFYNNCRDTTFLDSFLFDTTNLYTIATKVFEGYDDHFWGVVTKLAKIAPPIDGDAVYYFTHDLGIIYSKNTTWPCYKRLHSTNDSIENRINQYLEHILLNPEFVMKGDEPFSEIQTYGQLKKN